MDEFKTELLFRLSAWFLVVALCLLVLLNVVVAKSGTDALNTLPSALRIPIGLVGAAGALAFFALWSGMLWNCAVVSKRSVAGKALWLLFILFTGPIGALVYYFAAFQTRPRVQVEGN